MESSDTLLTIAEIAVALAGFGSLVSVIAPRTGDGESRLLSLFRLRLVLENSLLLATMALLPLPFLEVAGGDPVMWRMASGLFLAFNIGCALASIRRHRVSQLPPERNPLVYSMFVVASAGAVVGGVNVVGLGGTHAFSLYLASLVLGLVSIGLLFLMVVTRVFGTDFE